MEKLQSWCWKPYRHRLCSNNQKWTGNLSFDMARLTHESLTHVTQLPFWLTAQALMLEVFLSFPHIFSIALWLPLVLETFHQMLPIQMKLISTNFDYSWSTIATHFQTSRNKSHQTSNPIPFVNTSTITMICPSLFTDYACYATYHPEFVRRHGPTFWLPRAWICRALQGSLKDGAGHPHAEATVAHTHMHSSTCTAAEQLAFRALATRTPSYNLGLHW